MLLDCTVAVNGNRFNDGAGRPAGDPAGVILSGLKMIWGRSTTIDQPAPATCSFTVADWTGTAEALTAFPIGAPVDVDAAGTDYGAPSAGTFTDPSLTRTEPVTPALPGPVVELQLDGAGVTITAPLKVPPGHVTAFRPDDPDPNVSAWITIPRLTPGQTWQATITGSAPYGAHIIPGLAGFTVPADPGRVLTWWPALTATGPFSFAVTFTALDAWSGLWAGLLLQTLQWATWSTLPPAGAGTWQDQPQTWRDMATTTVDAVDVIAPAPDRELSVRVFSGRVTDVTAGWDDALGALVAEITAADFTADLANRRVSAAPWPTESAAARISRVLAASGATVTATVDPTLAGYLIARQDVDAQSPTALLEGVAVSVDAVMWAATAAPTGAYLRFEDVSARNTGRVLTVVDGLVTVTVDAVAHGALTLDSCSVIRDPVSWRQDTADVITRVGARWLELGIDDKGEPTETEHTEWVTDTTTEPVNGVRTVSVGTQLTTQSEAAIIGNAIASRVFGSGWRIDGLTVEETALADLGTVDGISPAATLAQLLDGTARNGLLTYVTNLPGWAPNALDGAALVYLEGGVYEYAGREWSLALVTSDPRGIGQSARWLDLDPGWSWEEFAPTVRWSDLYGAIVPTISTRPVRTRA